MTDSVAMQTSQAQRRTIDGVRENIETLLEAGHRDSAMQAARSLLKEQPGLRTWCFLRKMAESDAAAVAGLKLYRVALLSSFSIEFISDALIAFGFANGLRLQIYQSGFGAFRQALLDTTSLLYTWSPDVVVLAVEGEDWVPAAYGSFLNNGKEDAATLTETFRKEVGSLVSSLRSRLSVPLLVHNLAIPTWRPLGILDAGSAEGQRRLVSQLNDVLLAVADTTPGVHIVDYAALINCHGALRWHDERMRLYARAPIAQPMLGNLAREYLKFFRCLTGLTKKCLVLDLDNTLWGGIVGEDGLNGIQLGPTYPGSAFLEFQRHVLALQQRGVILAVASKNNPKDVEEVFTQQRFMQLRKEHFADLQVNWGPKSESLQRIAGNLGIGLEHIVLIDDNPAECEQVRSSLPMVTVLQLPPQPEQYLQALHEDGWFDTVTLSNEDRRRGDLYKQRADGEALRSSVVGLEDYYRALDMELRIAPIDGASLKRAAQLTQKTNQLNVTTRRYSEAQLASFLPDPSWSLATVSVTDRFGDNGIVGVMLARVVHETLNIDTFLLSCRVIGRAVETAMLAYLCDLAEQRGLNAVVGELISTAKNQPVRDLFEKHDFDKISEDADTSFWRICLPQQRVHCPDWFRVVCDVAQQAASATREE